MRDITFAKGHGTRNDFVVFTDQAGMLDLEPVEVRFLCDRRGGVGADGLLRAVRGKHIAEWEGDPDVWFMDYRNADGSIAEMCGNGVRVFVRYLYESGLVNEREVTIGTRAGARHAVLLPDDRVRVGMGPVRLHEGLLGPTVPITVLDGALVERTWDAQPVDVGNPHAVAFTDDIGVLDLTRQPLWPAGEFPLGVNAEFVRVHNEGHVGMRVYERGVGETESCGTGTVAVAAASAARLGLEIGAEERRIRVDVPGGAVVVGLSRPESDGPLMATLTGPAQLVFRGKIVIPDLG
ncbi:diaminopimelate epimerase [Raineyella fluvialis]|uniref:Diaminopimelate epimerase n=1 Tax=Raineyella fluvialis TaxID=2662261 RepID=A0A5Q2FI93_9ACTN|nr:diaminopimelate epimerase [Raineyella fluvialis]QGF25284.1 diaminopimelate epimerase [Raineyella fluvialis]